jgi:transcriptional regulator with XRE-family HTH domain
VASELVRHPTPLESASELSAFSDPSALGDHLDFAAFLASARKAREARGLTLSEVAARMGCDHAAVSRLESGKQPNPTVNTVMRYVEAIGLRIAWGLAERDDAPIPPGPRSRPETDTSRQGRRLILQATASRPHATKIGRAPHDWKAIDSRVFRRIDVAHFEARVEAGLSSSRWLLDSSDQVC